MLSILHSLLPRLIRKYPFFTPTLSPTILHNPILFTTFRVDPIAHCQHWMTSNSEGIEANIAVMTDAGMSVYPSRVRHEVAIHFKRHREGSVPYQCQPHQLFIAGAVKAPDIVIMSGIIAPTLFLFALTVLSLVWKALFRGQTKVLGILSLLINQTNGQEKHMSTLCNWRPLTAIR